MASADKLECIFNGTGERISVPLNKAVIASLSPVDYDNDGWLDIVASGDGIRIWRNEGRSGFKEVTQELGLSAIKGKIKSFAAADFDHDCDPDLLLDVEGAGLQLLRNDGGNANHQLKLRLLGNRSNPSGIGTRVEITVGGLRAIRTVRQLPIEIGVGRHEQLDAMTVHWFDLAWNQVDVKVDCRSVLPVLELSFPPVLPVSLCLGRPAVQVYHRLARRCAAGLPVAEGRYIEADADEYVWMGDDTTINLVATAS